MKQTIDQSPGQAPEKTPDQTPDQANAQAPTNELKGPPAQTGGPGVEAAPKEASGEAPKGASKAAPEAKEVEAAGSVKKKDRSRTLLFVSFVIACVLTIAGIVNMWKEAEETSTRYLTDVIAELDRSQGTIVRAWTGSFETALLSLADNSDFCEFTSKVSGMGLPRDVLLSLTGRAADRHSMLSLLAQRRSPEDQQKLREFTDMADSIRRELVDFAARYNFKSAYLFTREGTPCMGTDTIPPKFHDISRTFVLDITSTSKAAHSQPAYVTEGRLHVDIAAPMILMDKQSLLTYNVGVLVVTVDLGDSLERIQAAMNEQIGVRTYVLEEQADESLIVLSASSTQKVPLEDWTVITDSIPFGLRRLHGESEDAYVLGRRLLATNLFFLTALPRSSADNLASMDKDAPTRLGALVSGVLFVMAIFWVWLIAYGRMKRRLFESLEIRLRSAAQKSQMLGTFDHDIGIGIVCTDFDKNILFANDSFAKLSGRKKAGELQGLTTNDLPQDLAMDIAQHTAIVWEKGRPISAKARLCGQSGEWKTYGVHAAPYIDDKDYLTGLVVFYRDISDRLQGEQRQEALVEQTVGALHRLINSLDPHLGRLTTLVSEMAVLVAELDNNHDPKTARLLSICGRLFVFGNTAKPENQILRDVPGTNRKAPVGLPLMSMDFDGLPVAQTLADLYERLDGSGSPRKVSGDEISKASRYLAIAEAVCSIMYPREGEAPTDWEKAYEPLLDKEKYDAAAAKLFNYLKTPQGEKLLIRLRRK